MPTNVIGFVPARTAPSIAPPALWIVLPIVLAVLSIALASTKLPAHDVSPFDFATQSIANP